MPHPFHVALRVRDLEEARRFYGSVLGCAEGRSDDRWVDFDLYGHQLVCHLAPTPRPLERSENPVDGDDVPVPHCGAVLPLADWRVLAERLEREGVAFLLEPRVRFAGQPGEQGTFFLEDPSGNVLEFKGFSDLEMLFAR